MTAKKSGASPDKRRKYDKAFKAEARLEISHHIAYYNAERRHSSLAYQAPNHFETQFKTTSQLYPA